MYVGCIVERFLETQYESLIGYTLYNSFKNPELLGLHH